MRTFFRHVAKILGSRGLFLFTIAYFVFQSVWIALSARYPQAFDEGFHFGIIKIYAKHWSPFLSGQPAGGNSYGALARDPSYLYHYLMSFPYRFFELFTHNQTSLVIALRLIDVALFTVGLILFRQLLLKAKVSRALTNILLLIFTLIPIVPQLAAHINYDNLLIPLTAWSCLLTFKVVDEIRAQQPNIRSMVILTSVGLLASIVKYAYLPIYVAIVAFVVFTAIQRNRTKGEWAKLFRGIGRSWQRQSITAKVILPLVLVVGLGMFFQRDGLNVLQYHTVTPDCAKVLNVKACNQYTVWHADNDWHTKVLAHKNTVHYENPLIYFISWLYWLWYRLFFAVNGPSSNYTNYPPLPLPSAAAAVLAVAGVVTVIIWRHRIFRDQYLSFFLLASVLYLAALFISGWQDYHYTNVLVDMNGRYLLPVLLLLGAIIARAFSIALYRASTLRKTAIAFAAIVFFFQGGGVLTFITRSDASWDWPNSAIVHVNNAARDVTKPVIIKGSKSYSTKHWFFN